MGAASARGRWGEGLAERHYVHAGFEVLDRNWRCRLGELDLVVRRDRLIVFCEVKARRRPTYGGAIHAVGPDKQRRVRRLAAAWLAAQGHRDPARQGIDVRFDVVAVTGMHVEVIEGAF